MISLISSQSIWQICVYDTSSFRILGRLHNNRSSNQILIQPNIVNLAVFFETNREFFYVETTQLFFVVVYCR